VWQALREEVHPNGVEIVTVGLDAAGAEACRPFIETAQPGHPSLVDSHHRVADLFGVVNIPTGVWIDESGMIVRPAEPAQPRESLRPPRTEPIDGFPDHMNEILVESAGIAVDTRYAGMVRDWAEKGSGSEYVLSPDEVIRRSRPRDIDVATGQANFILGAHLWEAGDRGGAETHWREAHRLDPGNFSYKRQAWSLAAEDTGPFARFWQGPVPGHEEEWPYESDWLTEVRAKGAENYYEPLDP
jgi:hypothetical protein